ncbi:hypothetical protein [Colwellia sp. BRX9-1]|uniref:hypothetical protein n=1 Tax=Colwellia sp. BRX9-1 TaxID=2759830 RepID=UPI0015F3B1BE|nr:hypothetical protein [Colwellia sp. BRX9-1]MBA6352879.1 hypothetical protein [Colwellia sp. BRX9-1]
MKFGIVIPLKSKKISRDWQVTCDALKNTINSIVNQSDSMFTVIVAGHDCPLFLLALNDARIRFVEVNYIAPDRTGANFTIKDLINDKNLKIITGLNALIGEQIDWVYQLDSDDLIRSDFIESIRNFPQVPAIIIEGGYLLYQSAYRVIETNELDNLCGSTVVVNKKYLDLPDVISLEKIHDIPWTKYRHMNIYKFFLGLDKECIRTQEKLVTYLLASGDNFSDRWRDSLFKKLKWKLKPYIQGSKITKEFKKKFAIG